MATAASNADVAVILIDARNGVQVQTKRHSFICALLGIRNVVLAINKIDLVDFRKADFERNVSDYSFVKGLDFDQIVPIPISARFGDNVVASSANTPWYAGPSLLQCLEAIRVSRDAAARPFRFPVQWVNRPNAEFRGYAGTIAAGRIAAGDAIVVAASGHTTRVSRIITYDGELEQAEAGAAVTLTLEDQIDVARGDLLAAPESPPSVADQFAACVIWMDQKPLIPGRAYHLKIGTRTVSATVTTLKYRIDVSTREHISATTLNLNEIGLPRPDTTRCCSMATTSVTD